MGLFAKIGKKILGIGTKRPEETVVGSVINKLIPDVNLKKEIMLRIKEEYAKHEIEIDSMLLEDIQSARDMYIVELQQLKGKFLNFVRGIVRPYLSFLAGTIWGYTIINKIINKITPLLTAWDYAIISSVVVFYFGARHLEKAKILGKRK